MSSYGTGPYGSAPYGAEASSAPALPLEEVASSAALTSILEDEVLTLEAVSSVLAGSDAVTDDMVAVVRAVLAAMDAPTVTETTLGRSIAQFADVPAVSARLIGVVSETLRLDDRFGIVLDAVIADAAVLADLAAGDPRVTVALVDTLMATGQFQTSVSALAALVDVLALRDVLRSVADADLTDAAMLASELQAAVRAMEALVSGAMFSDELVGAAMVTVMVPDSVDLADSLDVGALRLAALTESMAIAVSLTLDGVPYLGLAMNTDTRGITEYDNYQYNSLAQYNGALYGAGPAGLYRLDGPDGDERVDAFLRTALLRIGGGKQARADAAYVGYRSDGTMQLKVITTGDGTKVAHVYDLAERPAGAPRPGRFKIGRGLKSVYWAFELSTKDGADFDLDILAIHPLILDRRLP